MANVDSPFGLRPIRHLAGGVIRKNAYTIADQYATALYSGDPVNLTGTGRNIGIATAGSGALCVGIFAGCQYQAADGEVRFSRYWPASTDVIGTVTAWVYDDPNILFIAQSSGSIAEADIGQLVDFASGTGSASTGTSGWEVGVPGGSENQLQLLGLHDVPSNAYGTNAIVEVLISKHAFRGALTEV